MGITSVCSARFMQMAAMTILSGLLYCCTTYPVTPLSEAGKGNNSLLFAKIQSGEINANDRLNNGFGYMVTPLCVVAIKTTSSNDDLQFLIDHGADVNKTCNVQSSSFPSMEALVNTKTETVKRNAPLDEVLQFIFTASVSQPRNPAFESALWEHVKFLLAHGAKFGRNPEPSSMAGANQALDRMVRQDQAQKKILADLREEEASRAAAQKREDAKNSFFSAENLGAAVAIAGGAVNNYAAAKGQTPSVSLPSLTARTSQPINNALPATKAVPTKPSPTLTTQSTLAAATPYGGSLSSCNAPDSMTTGVNGIPPACANNRNNTFGWGNNSADACSAARRSIVTEFDAQSHNRSGCYCKENNAKVNGTDQRAVCWIAFDY